MKEFFKLFVIVAILEDVTRATTKDALQKIRAECKEVENISDEMLGNVRHTGMVNMESIESLRKYAKCAAVKANFLGEDGVINYELVTKYLSGLGLNEKAIKEIFETCDGKDKPDDFLSLAVHYNDCFSRYMPRHARILVEQ